MKTFILSLIKKFFKIFGYDVVFKLPPIPKYNVKRIIDVGVAKGTDHLLKYYDDCFFIYIEPNPKYHKYIENTLLTQTRGVLLKFGAGKKSQILKFYDDSLQSGFLTRKDQNNNALNSIKVQVNRLDDLLENINFFKSKTNVLLNIDTEGYELNVLEGSSKLLSDPCLKFIQLELRISFIDTYNPSDIFVFLSKYNFEFYRVDKIKYKKKGISYMDITFKRK